MPDANPYTQLGRPIRTFEDFYGRKPSLAKITDDIRNGQCVSVVGIRRIGKTSLLFQSRDPQARATYHLPDEIMCVYFTAHRIRQSSPGQVYAEITQKIYQQLRQSRFPTFLQPPDEEMSYRAFENTILEIQDAGIRLVLLLDDFEAMAHNPNLNVDFFLGLRALHTENNLTYVTASLAPMMDLFLNQTEILSSPFPNIFDFIRLGLFSEIETREFIQVAETFSPETESFLVDLTGGHPLALQHACHFAFARRQETGRTLTRGDMFSISRQTERAMENHYRAYWQHLTLDQKRVLASPTYFATHTREGTPIENLFKDLVTQGLLIRHTSGAFDYAGRLFEEFVKHEIDRDVSLRVTLPYNLVGETLGSYHLVEHLGKGGMGDVYKARDPNLARDVVIKIMLPHLASDKGFSDRFRKEAQAIASLQHPHIVQIYSSEKHHDLHYMVMEYIAGENLQKHLRNLHHHGKTMPLSDIMRIIQQIGQALDYAHNQGVLHRDVKPANVMLRPDKNAILTDFGLAKLMAEAHTTGSALIGTPAYMAPEQMEPTHSVDRRVDVYALGILFYEMITGEVPFKARETEAILHQHQTTPIPNPQQQRPELPEAIIAILNKMLAKNPDQRYPTVAAMLTDLTKISLSTRRKLAKKAKPMVDTTVLRASLQRLDDVQFDTLCMDHFPEVYDQFGRGQRRDEKMNLLLDYVRRNGSSERLSILLNEEVSPPPPTATNPQIS